MEGASEDVASEGPPVNISVFIIFRTSSRGAAFLAGPFCELLEALMPTPSFGVNITGVTLRVSSEYVFPSRENSNVSTEKPGLETLFTLKISLGGYHINVPTHIVPTSRNSMGDVGRPKELKLFDPHISKSQT
jgi:hypothetical protein